MAVEKQGPQLVFDPEVPGTDVMLAAQAAHWFRNIRMLTVGVVLWYAVQVAILLLGHHPSVVMGFVTVFLTIAYIYHVHQVASRPLQARRLLLAQGRAVWVDDLETLQFYNQQTTRIIQDVAEEEQLYMKRMLFNHLKAMVRQLTTMTQQQRGMTAQDDTSYAAAASAHRHARNEYSRFKDEAIYIIGLNTDPPSA